MMRATSIVALLVAGCVDKDSELPPESNELDSGLVSGCHDVVTTTLDLDSVVEYIPDAGAFLDAYLGEHAVSLWLDDDPDVYEAPPPNAIEGVLDVDQIGEGFTLYEFSDCQPHVSGTFSFALTGPTKSGPLAIVTVDAHEQRPSFLSSGLVRKPADASAAQLEALFGGGRAFPEADTAEVVLELVRARSTGEPLEGLCAGHIGGGTSDDDEAPIAFAEFSCR